MRQHIFCLMSIASLLFTISCNRKDKDEVAGKGGNAILKITPQHHGQDIDSCKVYIKYNTLDAANSYDDSAWVIQVNERPVAMFSGLKKGNYYVFGKGWDPSIVQNVKGGIPYTITEEKTLEITLPVTEDH